MQLISIAKELKSAAPELALGYLSARGKVENHNDQLWQEMNQYVSRLSSQISTESIAHFPEILSMRTAYKALKKDPARYRGSAEALLRRIATGKGLYQINTVVDINNLVSLETLTPSGAYDLDKLKPPIQFRVGLQGEIYKGIGKDTVNIENLPVFADSQGPFGSPTSDSERAMIKIETERILFVLISFAGAAALPRGLNRLRDLLERYAAARDITSGIVA